MGRSWAVALALLLAGCQAHEPLWCDPPCLGPGGYVDVEGWMPALPFTVEVCVPALDMECTTVEYERCRPGTSCAYTVPHAASPGARHRRPVSLSTLGLDLGRLAPRDLDGRTVTVALTGPSGGRTHTSTFDYYAGGECCGDQAFASFRFGPAA